tara:strand:+ start:275 stop:526 length:252 start_codon:yes stop_codon:yes gene_type:complete
MVIKYFSWIKEHIGKSEEQITIPSDIINVDQLINYLNERDTKYNLLFEKKELIKIAVNKTYSSFDTKVSNRDEIAFFPPVTGG